MIFISEKNRESHSNSFSRIFKIQSKRVCMYMFEIVSFYWRKHKIHFLADDVFSFIFSSSTKQHTHNKLCSFANTREIDNSNVKVPKTATINENKENRKIIRRIARKKAAAAATIPKKLYKCASKSVFGFLL